MGLERWAGIRFLPVIIALFIGVKDRQLLGFLGMMGMALAFTDSAAVAGLNYPWELRSWMLQFGVTAHHYGVGMIVMNAWIPEYKWFAVCQMVVADLIIMLSWRYLPTGGALAASAIIATSVPAATVYLLYSYQEWQKMYWVLWAVLVICGSEFICYTAGSKKTLGGIKLGGIMGSSTNGRYNPIT